MNWSAAQPKQTVARGSLLATLICAIEATNSHQAKTGQAAKRISKLGEVSLLARKTNHSLGKVQDFLCASSAAVRG